MAPQLTLRNRQKSIPIPLNSLKIKIKRAITLLPPLPLPSLIEISFISKRAIGKVHQKFFNDPTPTDVITFPDGEILISPQIAKENTARFQTSLDSELLLYAIHGFLHLQGMCDKTDGGRKAMERLQEGILSRIETFERD